MDSESFSKYFIAIL